MSSISTTNNNPTEEVIMSTATTTEHRLFGVATAPVKLDGAFAEYAKPHFEFLESRNISAHDQRWCDWSYNGYKYYVRLNIGHAEDEATTTETLGVALAAWKIYCDTVDRHYGAEIDAELQSRH